MDNPREALNYDGGPGDTEKTKVVVSIPSNAVGTLVGPRGQTIDRLERETSCFIQVLRGERFSPEKHNKNHRHRAPLTDIMIQSWGDAGKIQTCIERLSSLLMGMVAIRKVYPAGVSGLDCHYVKVYQGLQCARNLNGPTKDNLSISGPCHFSQPSDIRTEFIFQTPWRHSDLKSSVIANLEKRSSKYSRVFGGVRPGYMSTENRTNTYPANAVPASQRHPEYTATESKPPQPPASGQSLRDRRNMSTLALGGTVPPLNSPMMGCYQMSQGSSPNHMMYNPYNQMVSPGLPVPPTTPQIATPYNFSNGGTTVLTLPYSQAGYQAQMSPTVNPTHSVLTFSPMLSPAQPQPSQGQAQNSYSATLNLTPPAQPVSPAKASAPSKALATVSESATVLEMSKDLGEGLKIQDMDNQEGQSKILDSTNGFGSDSLLEQRLDEQDNSPQDMSEQNVRQTQHWADETLSANAPANPPSMQKLPTKTDNSIDNTQVSI